MGSHMSSLFHLKGADERILICSASTQVVREALAFQAE